MINVKVGTDKDVVSELKTFKYVEKVYEVYGVYDIVAEVKVSSMEEAQGDGELGHEETEERAGHQHHHRHRNLDAPHGPHSTA